MKPFLTLILSLFIFSGCTDMPEDALNTLNDLGLSVEIGEINKCAGDQLLILQKALNESEPFDRLKTIIQKRNIEVLKIGNTNHKPVTCDYAIVDPNRPLNEMICDPSTIAGTHKDLKETQITVMPNVIQLTTESQVHSRTVILHKLHELSTDEERALVNELTIKTDNSEYISFKKLESLSINFNIERTSQSYIDTTNCGKSLSFDEIMEKLQGNNDAK